MRLAEVEDRGVSSGVSTLSTGANMVLKGWFSLIVSMVKATSSEVTGSPSWNVASRRRFRVKVSPSSADLPAFGQVGLRVPVVVEAQGGGEDLREGTPVAVPDCTAPLRCRGTWVETITRRPTSKAS
jgi:hypothetical protein